MVKEDFSTCCHVAEFYFIVWSYLKEREVQMSDMSFVTSERRYIAVIFTVKFAFITLKLRNWNDKTLKNNLKIIKMNIN